jgi:FtsP/CotA-like multicopper oxidase with cupredoxin domain
MSRERYVYALSDWTVEKRERGWYLARFANATAAPTGAVLTDPKPASR